MPLKLFLYLFIINVSFSPTLQQQQQAGDVVVVGTQEEPQQSKDNMMLNTTTNATTDHHHHHHPMNTTDEEVVADAVAEAVVVQLLEPTTPPPFLLLAASSTPSPTTTPPPVVVVDAMADRHLRKRENDNETDVSPPPPQTSSSTATAANNIVDVEDFFTKNPDFITTLINGAVNDLVHVLGKNTTTFADDGNTIVGGNDTSSTLGKLFSMDGTGIVVYTVCVLQISLAMVMLFIVYMYNKKFQRLDSTVHKVWTNFGATNDGHEEIPLKSKRWTGV